MPRPKVNRVTYELEATTEVRRGIGHVAYVTKVATVKRDGEKLCTTADEITYRERFSRCFPIPCKKTLHHHQGLDEHDGVSEDYG